MPAPLFRGIWFGYLPVDSRSSPDPSGAGPQTYAQTEGVRSGRSPLEMTIPIGSSSMRFFIARFFILSLRVP